MKSFDYIVVGSGCAGAMAAQTLVEAGKQVAMLDVGTTQGDFESLIPDEDFLSLRRADRDQYKYLIGASTEGVVVGELGKGAQLTPPRAYMTRATNEYVPLESTSFSPIESLGYGGLGIGWGLQCWAFSAKDLERSGLPIDRMRSAYELVSKRIGVSATRDDATKYTIGSLQHFQASAKMDRNHSLLLKNYRYHKQRLQQDNFYVGRTPLALLTEEQDGRKAYQYKDMDFYSDKDKSAWRPWITIDALRRNNNFTYIGGTLATSFKDSTKKTTVYGVDVATGKEVAYECRKLILAANALGTARIVMRALGSATSRVPLLCNPHTYIPFIQPKLLGAGVEEDKLGLGELSYFIDPDRSDTGLSVASSYSYQSLMMFRMINQIPLGFDTARSFLQYLMPAIVVMIVQHPDATSSRKYLQLINDSSSRTGDRLKAEYSLTDSEEKEWTAREKDYVRKMRRLRAFALKRVKTAPGASVHYAGTLPFSPIEKPLSLSPNGRLYGTQNVYVADSSGFTYLPAKGLTFSLLANAHLTTENVLYERA